MMPDPMAIIAELAVLVILLWFVMTPFRRRARRKRVGKQEKYTVQQGDTIMSIAKDYHLKWKRLARLNRLRAPYDIQPGQVLAVPAKKRSILRRSAKQTSQVATKDAPVSEEQKPKSAPPVAPIAPIAPAATPSVAVAQEAAPAPVEPPTSSWAPPTHVPQKPKKNINKHVRIAPLPKQKKGRKKRGRGKYDWAYPAIYYDDDKTTGGKDASEHAEESEKKRL